jgi:predicted Zn-dependent protease
MRAAGYEPAALARFFAVLEDKLRDHRDASILSTHPGTPQRQQAIRNYAAELEGRPQAR